ncbi:MAG TPA: adenosylmethionine decarboxylase [Fimbriimonadaceae bacterium]|nr:adenosylmethionine decarboxylase [Fimbriimonadaceae bacterium]
MVSLLGAAVLPRTEGRLLSWLRRLGSGRRRVSNAVAPPSIENDAGWQLVHSEDAERFRAWLGRDSEGMPYREDEEPSLGSHLLIELFDCDEKSLRAEASVGEAMLRAAQESDASIVASSFHEFKPYGVSGAVIIQESHYTIHTWPEHRYAAVDLFYCGGTIHVEKALDVLRERFSPARIKFLVVRRGIQSEVANR